MAPKILSRLTAASRRRRANASEQRRIGPVADVEERRAESSPSSPDWFVGGGGSRAEKRKKTKKARSEARGEPGADWFVGGGGSKKKKGSPRTEPIRLPNYDEVMAAKRRADGQGAVGDYRRRQQAAHDEDNARNMDVALGLEGSPRDESIQLPNYNKVVAMKRKTGGDYRTKQQVTHVEDHAHDMDVILGLK